MTRNTAQTGDWRRYVTLLCAVCALLTSAPAQGTTIRDLVRLEGHGEARLWGLGFVTGLPGTGDPMTTLPLARQLAALLERGGNPVPNLDELASGQNIAMVMVTCDVPKEGARSGDSFNVTVTSLHNAQSLEGGELFITPLNGPMKGHGVFAMASGPISIEGVTPTRGIVRNGAKMIVNHVPRVISESGTVELLVQPEYAGWPMTRLIADAINSDQQGLGSNGEIIARAINERSVVVTIPEAELLNGVPANFIANIMEIYVDPSLLSLPARVLINERAGIITITGNVEISPATITHKDLVITTVVPEPPADPNNPRRETTRWANVTTNGNDQRAMANLVDLQNALKDLDVPVRDQIAILKQLHRSGHLHAEFVVE